MLVRGEVERRNRRGKGRKGRTHLEPILCLHSSGSPLVDRHRPLRQSVLLLELSVEEVEGLGVLRRAGVERLLEEVACSLELGAALYGREGSVTEEETRERGTERT